MKITQGILKGCNVIGITFNDKYSDIKTILTANNYNSKFSQNVISQTATVLSNNNMYYNTVENCTLIICNIENGRFIDSFLSGNTTNYINDGHFSGCTISGYTINGGDFYNCIISSNNIWNTGNLHNNNGANFGADWNGGVWNSGVFSGNWSGGTFNGGSFVSPSIWYDGVANGGIFSGITWHNGLATGDVKFIDNCKFLDGTFNSGSFINSVFVDGIFNGGVMSGSTISGGTFNDGVITDNCIIYSGTTIDGGTFINDTINNADVYNINASNLIINNGNFYGGSYADSTFINGNIYYGEFFNVFGSTTGLTIYNGLFRNSFFNNTNVKNGNFTNCLSRNLKWNYGIYTDGEMYDSNWMDGYWNDGIFSNQSYVSGISNTVSALTFNTTSTTTTTSTTIYSPPVTRYGYNVSQYTSGVTGCVFVMNRTIADSHNALNIGSFYLGDDGIDYYVFKIIVSGVDISAGGYLITNLLGTGYHNCSNPALIPFPII